jgi:transcriptional regulator with XRE-family HTH domain
MSGVATTPQRVRFGQALRSTRANGHLTQGDIAMSLGITQTAFSNWERGSVEPKPEQVFDLEQVLGVEAGSLSRYLGYVPVNADEVPDPPIVEPRHPRFIPDAILHDSDGNRILVEVKRGSGSELSIESLAERLAQLEKAVWIAVEHVAATPAREPEAASSPPTPGKPAGSRGRQGPKKKPHS